MTSRELARASIRLVGLLFLATTVLSGELRFVVWNVVHQPGGGDASMWEALRFAGVPSVVFGAFGLLFVLRGRAIADRLRIGADEPPGADRGSAASSALFATAATVLGTLCLVDLADPIAERIDRWLEGTPPAAIELVQELGVGLVAGAAFLLGPGRVGRFPHDEAAASSPRPRPMSAAELAEVLLRVSGLAIAVLASACFAWLVLGFLGFPSLLAKQSDNPVIAAVVLSGVVAFVLLRRAKWFVPRPVGVAASDSDFVLLAGDSAGSRSDVSRWTGRRMRAVGLVFAGVLMLVWAFAPIVTLAHRATGLERNGPAGFRIELHHVSVRSLVLEVALYVVTGSILALTPKRIVRVLRDTFLLRPAGDSVTP